MRETETSCMAWEARSSDSTGVCARVRVHVRCASIIALEHQKKRNDRQLDIRRAHQCAKRDASLLHVYTPPPALHTRHQQQHALPLQKQKKPLSNKTRHTGANTDCSMAVTAAASADQV